MTRRIAIFLPNLRVGGAEMVHLVLAKEWALQGIHVDFVLMQAIGNLLPEVPDGCRVIDLRCTRIRQTFRPIASYLRRERPDAMIAAMWPLTVLAPTAARLARTATRVIISEHTNISMTRDHLSVGSLRLPDSLSRSLRGVALSVGYRLADARIAVSEGVARDAEANSHLPRGAFRVIHNPTPAMNPRGEAPLPEALLSLPPRLPLILTVGNLKPAKDHQTLLYAFARISEVIDARLCIIGEGPLRHELERIADKLGIGSKVFLPGFQDPAPFYKRADVFALSSTREGFGNVLVEAMQFGLPIVSTDCPSGPAEILENGRYGRLVPVGDPYALADAILQSINYESDRERQKLRASAFAPSRISQSYLDVIFPEGLHRDVVTPQSPP
jgi:glycosyltransferase involved in cell wall biosynthesis